METIKTTTKQLNVLMIDHDKDVVHGVEEYIKTHELKEKHGVNLSFADNVKAALKSLSENKADLIVMEIILPIVNGYYFLEALKTIAPNTPVVVYTRLRGAEDLAKLSTYNVQNIFLKQLTKYDELLEAIVSQKNDPRDLDELVMELQTKLKAVSTEEDSTHLKVTQCPKCHLVISPNSHFCNNCGQKITKAALQEQMNKMAEQEAIEAADHKKEAEARGIQTEEGAEKPNPESPKTPESPKNTEAPKKEAVKAKEEKTEAKEEAEEQEVKEKEEVKKEKPETKEAKTSKAPEPTKTLTKNK